MVVAPQDLRAGRGAEREVLVAAEAVVVQDGIAEGLGPDIPGALAPAGNVGGELAAQVEEHVPGGAPAQARARHVGEALHGEAPGRRRGAQELVVVHAELVVGVDAGEPATARGPGEVADLGQDAQVAERAELAEARGVRARAPAADGHAHVLRPAEQPQAVGLLGPRVGGDVPPRRGPDARLQGRRRGGRRGAPPRAPVPRPVGARLAARPATSGGRPPSGGAL
mmetsp:Transcript_72814/g.193391  ORF Transcript_72814/g.193391 Transcript_72814/m.193391 type:complete len:225 (-) Transcript_72814:233-907(-)